LASGSYLALSQWWGEELTPEQVTAASRLPVEQAIDLAETLLDSEEADGGPSPVRPGELRPCLTPRRLIAWEQNDWGEVICCALLYAHRATTPDPLSRVVHAWTNIGRPRNPDMAGALASAMGSLLYLKPMAQAGILELLPARYTRFSPGVHKILADEIRDAFWATPLADKIGNMQRELGGSHGTGIVAATGHLNELCDDLSLIARYPDVLQLGFLHGLDFEIARFLLGGVKEDPRTNHLSILAAFQFPEFALTPRDVVTIRSWDGYAGWRTSLSTALSAVDLNRHDPEEAQAIVTEELIPYSEMITRDARNSGVLPKALRQGVTALGIGGVTTTAGAIAGSAVVPEGVMASTGAVLASALTALNAYRESRASRGVASAFLGLASRREPFERHPFSLV
jgi:hypothetical protein